MNRGSPPTAANARTGEFTPPGIVRFARSNSRRDLSMSRGLTCRDSPPCLLPPCLRGVGDALVLLRGARELLGALGPVGLHADQAREPLLSMLDHRVGLDERELRERVLVALLVLER